MVAGAPRHEFVHMCRRAEDIFLGISRLRECILSRWTVGTVPPRISSATGARNLLAAAVKNPGRRRAAEDLIGRKLVDEGQRREDVAAPLTGRRSIER
jgi:hypothetical protein